VASDPPSPTEGDIWYNTTSNTVKGYVYGAAAWATGGNYPTAVFALASAGTQTAGLGFGGYDYPAVSPASKSLTAEYDGSAWTSGGSLPAITDSNIGAGTQTAAINWGGFTVPRLGGSYRSTTNEYDGSSWSSGGSLPQGYNDSQGYGIQTAAAFGGGGISTPGSTNSYLEYDGSTWTSGNPLTDSRRQMGATGTQTAGLIVVGSTPGGNLNTVQEHDGTSWANVNNFPKTQSQNNAIGTQTAATSFFGEGYDNQTFDYDGTSFSASTNVSTGRRLGGKAGDSSAGLGFCGYHGGNTGIATEELTGAAVAVKTLTSS